jgi:MFS family permease
MSTMTAHAQAAGLPAQQPVLRGVVAATVAGNALEFYDFVTYAFFAVYIGQAFFPAPTPFMSLLLSVAVFGVGFVTRPLGGILIGALADRAGRKPAMLLTIGLITVGTLGLAVTPSYASIGIAAPIIVVLARLVQGLALGGEVGPSTSFLIEIAPPGRRGLYSSWQLASQGLSSLAAGIVGVAMAAMLSKEQLHDWGWRVPFALGLLLVPIAVYLRRRMPETLETGGGHSAATRVSQIALLKENAGLMVLATVLVLGGTVATYVALYMTTYAITVLKLPSTVSMAATVAFGAATFLCSLIGGWAADRFGRKPAMLLPRVGLLLLAYPAFVLLSEHKDLMTLLGVTVLLGGLTAASSAAGMAVLPELMPLRVRALGLAITYALGVSLFGGTTQFVITWLIGTTGNPLTPAWYVVGTSLITVVAILMLPESRHKALDN